MMHVFRILARLKGLRGGKLDIFGYTAERRQERALLEAYEKLLLEIADSLTPEKYALAIALLSMPEKIRGYGHVKERHMAAAACEEQDLLTRYRAPLAPIGLAAE
jgi:indolepyruvate ferredoxin oxidoreductase